MKKLSKPGFWLARSFTASLGICSLAWVIYSLPVFRAEVMLSDTVQTILSGESYNATQLDWLERRLDAIPPQTLRSTALNDVAVIRLKLTESKLVAHDPQIASDLSNLNTAVTAALEGTPSSSFLWLIKYWIQQERGGAADDGLKLLRMSYSLGPNESWIAIRRLPLALRVFSSLPPDIADQTLSEFAGLVRSHFYQEAADIVAGPGWAVHEKLLGRLAELKKSYRNQFAQVLASKDLEGASVPGADVGERRSRPF
ncbi:MAG: hypothetical protein KGL35_28930 [Bradyrhizobium sp.]|uniref:hypothetical protein n=1 Tax=Bradyrhizobium sp. TaxID=376 RepID=UPI001C289C2D|nr:hypothetical protein [Bradyrhizobium sp.]MBU6461127.1 hypothetical protein [Pseudomonadota bacterium]MDE2066203.1 hypothetical protein [Bradyrhizobium sp.]MDE2472643.1 hypothetical protein [Bradyrhizobium sp.]